MQMTRDIPGDVELDRQRRTAARFFWAWLITATAMSVTGNVAHAVLHADSGIVALAAGAALVPPVVLLAATHSIAVLVRIRAGGLTYWCALVMTFALAACAFVLSFDALRSLAVTLGLHESIAWLWPCAIDVAIAQATVCLLSLSRRAAVAVVSDAAAETVSLTGATGVDLVGATPVRGYPIGSWGEGSSTQVPAKTGAESGDALMPSVTTADIERWRPVAESIVLEGVTSKPARLVATILALREAGASPSTIGRHHDVHPTSVGTIVSAAEAVTA
jgi:uncharacterized protein DUF2637